MVDFEAMEMEKYSWPDVFMQRMRTWLGEEAVPFFEALGKRDVGLRLNSARGTLPALRARIPWETKPVPWCPESLWVQEEGADVGAHPYHAAGLYYIQDPSAMAAGVLLDPQPGEWVLDLAAAPGGKATHLAARMGNDGVLVANDVARRRTSVLAMNLERMGVTHALISNETSERLCDRWAGLFDAVLVDAPCSGEGMFSRDPRAVRDWSLDRVAYYAERQRNILADAALLVRPGGRLLYGTCTFSPEEDEGTIAAFLATHDDFEGVSLPALPGLYPSHPEWVGAPISLWACAGRFWPHKGPGHGHFYALLRRKGTPPSALPERWSGVDVPGRSLQLYQQEASRLIQRTLPETGLLLTKNDDLYQVPLAPELWRGLKVLRPGWWLGSVRHGKFNLDHALAMALRPGDVTAQVTLTVDDPRLVKFFRGGFWADDGPDGVVLVTVDGFPLGWAKRRDGRCRSRYPVHLRK